MHGSREWTASVNGTGLLVEQDGAGADAIVFSHALFLTRRMFDAPVAALSGAYRCIRYDHRGQGDSGFGTSGSSRRLLGVEGLYEDAVALLEQLQLGPSHWVGASVGAFVGMRLAVRRPDLVRSLVLISPRVRPNARSMLLRVDLLGLTLRVSHPLGPIGDAVRRRVTEEVMHDLFGGTFMSDPACAAVRRIYRERVRGQLVPNAVPVIRAVLRFPENPPEMLARIQAPTLVLAGEDDRAGGNGCEHARETQRAIPRARLVTVPGAGHIVLVEQPQVATNAITEFIRTANAA